MVVYSLVAEICCVCLTESEEDQRKVVQQGNVLLIIHTGDTQAIVRVSLLIRRKVEALY